MKRIEPIKPTSSESLSKKVVRGGIWVFALRITDRGLGFVRTIILARLLAPSDFGLLGIAMLAISTLDTFSKTGFDRALIQKKEGVESHLDTAWTVSAIRGGVLFLILYFSAPWVATFFNSPKGTLVIRVIAAHSLFSGLRNIGILFFQKELQFDKQFIYELSGTLVHLAVAISLAFILRNVWALVWGGLTANFVRLFMSYILDPYRPRIRFEKEKFRDLFSFGRWILCSTILVFLLTQGDDILVGKIFGVTALGLYQMAYLISNVPATEITHVISQVTFPAYSKLQDKTRKLTEAYSKVLQITAFLSFPIAALIFILAPEFTKIFLGEKWMSMVQALQALCIFGITRTINATITPIFQAIGKPHINTFGSGLQLVVFAALIYPLTTKWGILGTSIAVIIPNMLFMLYIMSKAANVFGRKLLHLTSPLFAPTTGTVAMSLALSLFKLEILIGESLIDFVILTLTGICIYLVMIGTIDKMFGCGLKHNLKQLVKQAAM